LNVGDKFIVISKFGDDKEYLIVAKGIINRSSAKKGYFCIDKNKQPKFYSYTQFHVLKSQDVIRVKQ
jgi:hypothetical protein